MHHIQYLSVSLMTLRPERQNLYHFHAYLKNSYKIILISWWGVKLCLFGLAIIIKAFLLALMPNNSAYTQNIRKITNLIFTCFYLIWFKARPKRVFFQMMFSTIFNFCLTSWKMTHRKEEDQSSANSQPPKIKTKFHIFKLVLKGQSNEIFDPQFFFIIRTGLGHWLMG